MTRTMTRTLTFLAAIAFVLAGPVSGANASGGDDDDRDAGGGNVYTLTNSAAGNAVIVFARSASGALTMRGTYPTGGLGGALGSQGAVVRSEDGNWLYAVNAGSNDLSVFRVDDGALVLTDRGPSGGIQPISVTTSHDLVYVVNAASRNIAGFTASHGTLTPIDGSTQSLIGMGPAEISFSPSGRVLVVSEKATNSLETFVIGSHGAAGAPTSFASAGATPFGFDFGSKDQLFVSEAALSSASSYRVEKDGSLTTVSAVVPTTQAAACWLVVTKNGRWAYTANAGSDSISKFAIDRDGRISLVQAQAAYSAGAHTTDMALARNSRFLYALDGGTHMISAFRIDADGTLMRLPGVGVPAGASGLAAR
jgi:6-phosphogluconolactonase (cycloisomerase 2 family)